MFAYGRAGSGKTYTVGSAAPGAEESPHRGIIPSAIREIFDRGEGEDGLPRVLVCTLEDQFLAKKVPI